MKGRGIKGEGLVKISGEREMAKEERIIEDRLQELFAGMNELGYKEHWMELTRRWVNELQERGVDSVDKFVRRLERCTKGSDEREYWDVLMEGRVAVMLARNNFSAIEVEYSREGPDIKADWNRNTIYFEVTRKRSKVDEWAEQAEEVELPSHKAEDIIGKIKSKLKQLKLGEINIVVFWSDTVAVGERELEEAFEYIQQEDQNTGVYKDLSAILFTESGGVSYGRLSPFYLFKSKYASKPLGTRLARKLKSLHEENPRQLKRKFEKLAAALKQLDKKRNT